MVLRLLLNFDCINSSVISSISKHWLTSLCLSANDTLFVLLTIFALFINLFLRSGKFSWYTTVLLSVMWLWFIALLLISYAASIVRFFGSIALSWSKSLLISRFKLVTLGSGVKLTFLQLSCNYLFFFSF